MTDNPNAKDTVAVGGFALALAAVAGGAGLVVAALAVGLQRAMGRDSTTRPDRVQASRDRYQEALDWLARDRAAEQERRRLRKQWWQDGADPDTKPADPPLAKQVAAWLRRSQARTVVAATRFGQGWRDGWNAAGEVRAAGGGFRDIAAARPPAPTPTGDTPEPDNTSTPQADADQRPEPNPTATPQPEPTQEEPMTAPTDTRPAQAPIAGDTNLDVTVEHLAQIAATQQQIGDLVDQLAALRSKLQTQSATAAEHAETTGATANTTQALDAANTLAGQISELTGVLADTTVDAIDHTRSAADGLRPAQDAQDLLHTSGARGKFLDTATDA